MDVVFPEKGFSQEEKGEIDDVLRRISVGQLPGEWRSLPDEIQILGRLSGGRSGSEVLEVVVKRGIHQARKVIKLGPAHDLENEFKAFQEYLPSPSASFVPIEAATPIALSGFRSRSKEREAVVYDHAARFIRNPNSETRTFEDLALEAMHTGSVTLEKAVKVLEALFEGVSNNLYEKYKVQALDTTLQKPLNSRLGIDAVVAIDLVDPSNKILATSYHPPFGAKQAILRPLELASASVRVDGTAEKGDLVQVRGARMIWHGTHLIAEDHNHYLRIDVVSDDTTVDQLTSLVEDGSQWLLRGQLVSLRMEAHREHLLNGLGNDYSLNDGILDGPDARVPDPFVPLPIVMESRRPHRITSVIHGDMNPRNILVIDETPCLIDYALTNDDEPILMDFARLEGILARDVLPADFTWTQHVRLQRLLAAACRLGDEVAQRFAERLATDRAELSSAFQLLWTIRRAARAVYPQSYKYQWMRDYMEQLFLFAHLTLKWDDKEELASQKLHATAALLGVAAEALSGRHIYDLWSEEELREDGDEIIQAISSRPQVSLSELANMARVLHRLDSKTDAVLYSAFEDARTNFVRHRFRDAAYAVLEQLHNDHKVFINLKAYIDLKGQLKAGGYQRQRRSFESMLEVDELPAVSEHLQEDSGIGEDVLHLIAENPAVVLIGDAGSGKTTVAREWEYRLARSVIDQGKNVTSSEPANISNDRFSVNKPCIPIVLRAPDLPERLLNWNARDLKSTLSVLRINKHDRDLLTIGAFYIIIDALNELVEGQKQRVADWIIALRDALPNTPVLVCHRQYNYVPGLLPFPIVTLQKVEIEQARSYVYNYLREKEVRNHERLAHQLVRFLMDDPEHVQVRDLAQTPLFLWMIVERYGQTGEIPESRGSLFETFSRWYLEQRYRETHDEPITINYGYEEKALLLGALGYELVQRRTTDLPERDVWQLIPQSIIDHSQSILDEIVAAEMLYRSRKQLRFLHQSFQEYFAARHFLLTETNDPVAIRRKVWQFGWHDTFEVLLSFAGDAAGVVTQVIEEASKVNPLLTARFLRMAEQPDPRLLERFVSTQETILKTMHAGEFAHERAAQALAEHGRGIARAALWRVASDIGAPEEARVIVLKRLATMPAQVRFERVAERIRQEMVNYLSQIFDEQAPVTVQQAAISAIVETQLKELGPYLVDLIATGVWPLRWAAWQACSKLGLKLNSRQQIAFAKACRERLYKLEEELFQETVLARIAELNVERVAILGKLAVPDNLPLLLKRRFSFGIQDEMRVIVDQMAVASGEVPVKAQEAWIALTTLPSDNLTGMDRWMELLHGPDDLAAIAAAHRMIPLGSMLKRGALESLLSQGFSPERLSAIARLIAVSQDKLLAGPLEVLIRSLMGTIISSREFEAFSNLVEALRELNGSMGNRIAAVATTIFWTSRKQFIPHQYFPWRMVTASIYLEREDYEALLDGGKNEIRAVIFKFNNHGVYMLQDASQNVHPIELRDAARLQLQNLAKNEQDLHWQYRFACASVYVHEVNLLTWLIQLTHTPEMSREQVSYYDSRYGEYEQCYLSDILRAIGYLARVLLEKLRMSAARPATVAFLRERYITLQPNEERSIVIGLTTGLGYLGDWEPILTHLGPREPWMHQAAQNVFEYWVPTPLKTASVNEQREEAAIWIARRLRDHSDLPPQARSTLERIKEKLERQLGRHIQVEDV